MPAKRRLVKLGATPGRQPGLPGPSQRLARALRRNNPRKCQVFIASQVSGAWVRHSFPGPAWHPAGSRMLLAKTTKHLSTGEDLFRRRNIANSSSKARRRSQGRAGLHCRLAATTISRPWSIRRSRGDVAVQRCGEVDMHADQLFPATAVSWADVHAALRTGCRGSGWLGPGLLRRSCRRRSLGG